MGRARSTNREIEEFIYAIGGKARGKENTMRTRT
jgi:hypothetical protein